MSALNEIEIFSAIIERGTFVAAADHLNVPKSTVSRKIEELETRLGVRLLQRTTRKMSLTEAGQAYYDHCGRVLEELANAERAVSELSGAPRGNLRVVAPFSIASRFLSQLLPEFLRRYPQVRTHLLLSNDRHEGPVEGNFDVAIRVGALPDSSLANRRLGMFHPSMFASASYEKEKGLPSSPAQLQDHRTLALLPRDERNRQFYWQLERAAKVAAGPGAGQLFPIEPVLVSNDPDPLVGATLGGEGIVLVPETLVRGPLLEGRIVRVLPEWRGVATPVNAIFPSRQGLSPKTRVFLDFITENLV